MKWLKFKRLNTFPLIVSEPLGASSRWHLKYIKIDQPASCTWQLPQLFVPLPSTKNKKKTKPPSDYLVEKAPGAFGTYLHTLQFFVDGPV